MSLASRNSTSASEWALKKKLAAERAAQIKAERKTRTQQSQGDEGLSASARPSPVTKQDPFAASEPFSFSAPSSAYSSPMVDVPSTFPSSPPKLPPEVDRGRTAGATRVEDPPASATRVEDPLAGGGSAPNETPVSFAIVSVGDGNVIVSCAACGCQGRVAVMVNVTSDTRSTSQEIAKPPPHPKVPSRPSVPGRIMDTTNPSQDPLPPPLVQAQPPELHQEPPASSARSTSPPIPTARGQSTSGSTSPPLPSGRGVYSIDDMESGAPPTVTKTATKSTRTPTARPTPRRNSRDDTPEIASRSSTTSAKHHHPQHTQNSQRALSPPLPSQRPSSPPLPTHANTHRSSSPPLPTHTTQRSSSPPLPTNSHRASSPPLPTHTHNRASPSSRSSPPLPARTNNHRSSSPPLPTANNHRSSSPPLPTHGDRPASPPLPTSPLGGGGGGGVDVSEFPDDSENWEPQVPCGKCGRRFTRSRITKHAQICGKQSKRKVFNASAQRAEGLELETVTSAKPARKGSKAKSQVTEKPKTSKWREEHEAFMANLKAMKKYNAAVAKGEDTSAIVIPSATSQTSLVPCPHCDRRFNEQAAERHIPKCKTTVNKPRALGSSVRSNSITSATSPRPKSASTTSRPTSARISRNY